MAQPKMDLKMFVMPAMLLLSRKIAFTTPNPDYICDEDGTCPKDIPKDLPNVDMIQKAQMGLATVVVVLMTLFYYVYSRVQAKGKDADKEIWVPPKPKPTLPFGMGPPPEEIKAEDFKKTTLREHEMSLVKESASGMVFPIGIAFFMSLKMNVHVSLLMQAVMVPLNAFDSLVLKKYVLGADGGYGELAAPPTAAILKDLNEAAGAGAAAVEENKDDTPRVVELPDKEEEKPKTDVKDID
jgi:hypothetical protein